MTLPADNRSIGDLGVAWTDGDTDNYSKSWSATLSDLWAALRGSTSGTELSQTHKHADDSTDAFTVTVSEDGDRTFS